MAQRPLDIDPNSVTVWDPDHIDRFDLRVGIAITLIRHRIDNSARRLETGDVLQLMGRIYRFVSPINELGNVLVTISNYENISIAIRDVLEHTTHNACGRGFGYCTKYWDARRSMSLYPPAMEGYPVCQDKETRCEFGWGFPFQTSGECSQTFETWDPTTPIPDCLQAVPIKEFINEKLAALRAMANPPALDTFDSWWDPAAVQVRFDELLQTGSITEGQFSVMHYWLLKVVCSLRISRFVVYDEERRVKLTVPYLFRGELHPQRLAYRPQDVWNLNTVSAHAALHPAKHRGRERILYKHVVNGKVTLRPCSVLAQMTP